MNRKYIITIILLVTLPCFIHAQSAAQKNAQDSSIVRMEIPSDLPQSNIDGSITILWVDDYQLSIMPMTDSRTKSAFKPDNEITVLIKKYEAVLAKNPNDYQVCIMLSVLYIDRNRPGDERNAIRYSNMALALENNSHHALFIRSLAHLNDNENEKAINDLESLMQINLQSVKIANYLLGVIYYNEYKKLRARNLAAANVKLNAAIEAFENVGPNFVDTNEILRVLYSRRK